MASIAKYYDVEYIMPFLFCNDIFIPIFKKIFENEINPVKYVYGSTFCEWGLGGRPINFKIHKLGLIEKYLKKIINQYRLIPTFTFNNLNVKDSLKDEYSNSLLDIAYSLDCRFIVATEELYNHIKLRYPDAKLHCSVIIPSIKIIEDRNFNETEFYNKMLEKYEVVVIRPEYTMDNIDKLDKLLSDISRVEILINQHCQYNCPHHREHYYIQSEISKHGEDLKLKKYDKDTYEFFYFCPKKNDNYRSVMLSEEQIEKAINLGVKKIKIQGRSFPFDLLLKELFISFFSQEYSEDEIRKRIDKICAELIQNNKKIGLFLSI